MIRLLDNPRASAEAIGLMEAAFAIRHVLLEELGNFTYDDLASRIAIDKVNLPGEDLIPCLCVRLDGLGMHDGVHAACQHQGACAEPHRRNLRYHGTRNLIAVLQARGIQNPSERPLQGLPPCWFHFEAHSEHLDFQAHCDDLAKALQYSAPERLTSSTRLFRSVIVYDIRCFNSCGNKRAFRCTRADCSRYSILGVYIFLNDRCSRVRDFWERR